MNAESCLALMARSARASPESVKTRLAPAVPFSADRVALYEAFLTDTLAAARRACALTGAALRVACTPAGAGADFLRFAVAPGELLPQREKENLGARERGIFEDLFAAGFARVVVIGSDLPTLPAAHVVEAFAALEADPSSVVLGPTDDGGYYLIGLEVRLKPDATPASAAHVAFAPADVASGRTEVASGRTDVASGFSRTLGIPDLFSSIRWSTPHAFDDTCRAVRAARLSVRLIPAWHDVDDPAALARLRDELRQPAVARTAPSTAAALAALFPGAAARLPPRPDRL